MINHIGNAVCKILFVMAYAAAIVLVFAGAILQGLMGLITDNDE